MHAVAVMLLLAAEPSVNPNEAEVLFRQARSLIKDGHLAEACPLLEKSQQLDPGLGTLLNLADCYEQTGRGVKAYLSFNEAVGWAERTHEAKREEVARAHAAALKAKLSWLVLSSPTPLDGLTATVADFQLPLATGVQSVPVDPGVVRVTAAAPGYQAWNFQLTIGPAETRTVAIPPLAPLLGSGPAPVVEPPPPAPAPTTAVFVADAPSPAPAPKGPVVLIAAGGAAVVAGTAGLIWSFSTYQQLQLQQPGQPHASNPTVTSGQFQTLVWMYPASWTAVGVGCAAIAAGGYWRWKGAPASVALMPGRNGPTLALSGSF
jgi:hypothetical protein